MNCCVTLTSTPANIGTSLFAPLRYRYHNQDLKSLYLVQKDKNATRVHNSSKNFYKKIPNILQPQTGLWSDGMWNTIQVPVMTAVVP